MELAALGVAGGTRRLVLAAAVVCLALFVTLTVLVDQRWAPLVDADHHLGAWPQDFTADHDGARRAWLWIGRLSSGWVLVPAVLAAVARLHHRGHRTAAVWAAGVIAVVLVANPVVKQLVGRDRPLWDDPILVIGSRAFPSGHAANNAAIAGVAIVLALRMIRTRSLRRAAITAAVLGALLVGADRVFLGVHHCSDVLGGYLLAATVVLLGLVVADPGPPGPPRDSATAPDRTTDGS
jgi:membrane-associated phospholipid phosphatase